MKINKCVVAGIIVIIFAIGLNFTDVLTPFIRPVTYCMLMGSTKGKDIIFFLLFGLFLILSQLKLDINEKKYLKITLIVGLIALLTGIALELIMRIQLGLGWNTILVGMNPNMCSTSIIHSHVYKTIFGSFFHETIPAAKGITEASSLYPYLPAFSNIFVIYFPILFILEILAIQKRNLGSTLILCIVLPCLLIAILDGGIFATPSYYGIFGCWIIYRNQYYIDYYFSKIFRYKNKYPLIKPDYTKYDRWSLNFLIRRFLPYIMIGVMILFRIGIMLLGSDVSGYELIIANPRCTMTIVDNFTTIKTLNETHYILDPNYNEMDLLINLKFKLAHKCDYYSLSWNGFSYLK